MILFNVVFVVVVVGLFADVYFQVCILVVIVLASVCVFVFKYKTKILNIKEDITISAK